MVKTSEMRAKHASRRRSYARHLKASPCRGKKRATCRRSPGCTYANGMKKKFCRKSNNSKRMKRISMN